MSYAIRTLKRFMSMPVLVVLIILIAVFEMPLWVFGLEVQVFSNALSRVGDWCE